MRIGINLVFLDPGRTGGAETYCRKLLAQLQIEDTENDYVVFAARNCPVEFHSPRFERLDCPVNPAHSYRRILYEQTLLPRLMKSRRLDAAHFPYSTSPLLYSPHYAVTIHDTLRFQQPRLAPFALRRYYAVIQRHIAAAGKRVIAVSKADAAVMADRLRLRSDRLSVVYSGVDEIFLRPPTEGPPLKRDCVLWVGRLYPHKGLDTLFRACALLRRRGVDLPQLRVIGADEADRRRLAPALREMGVGSLVSLEGPVPHDRLPAIYRQALLFCYPSICESLGMPILEAMACGAAVVCSDIPAFREIAGDAAEFRPAASPKAFAEAIAGLLKDSARREALAAQGRPIASRFTWARTARDTMEVYRKTAQES